MKELQVGDRVTAVSDDEFSGMIGTVVGIIADPARADEYRVRFDSPQGSPFRASPWATVFGRHELHYEAPEFVAEHPAAITHERTQMLTQTKIVLDRSEKPSSDRNVLFEAPAEDDYQAQTKLVLDLDTYVEMGGPAVVTVTVEPRDTLNDDAKKLRAVL